MGPLGPREGLRTPQHQGKPGANCSKNEPYWALLAASWDPLGPSWVFGGLSGGALGPPGVLGSRLGRPQGGGCWSSVWGRSWGLGALSGISCGCIGARFGHWGNFTRPNTAAHPRQTGRTTCPFGSCRLPAKAFLRRLWALLGLLGGALGPSRALGALKPYWACLGALSRLSWVPEKASETSALRQIRGKLVEQQALLGLLRCLLGPSWAPGGAPCAPAPGQTRGKLVGQWARPLKPSWLPPGTLLGRLVFWGGPTGSALGPPGVLGSRLGRPLGGGCWSSFWPFWGALGFWGSSWASLGAVLGRLLRKLNAPQHRGKPTATAQNATKMAQKASKRAQDGLQDGEDGPKWI